MVKLLFDKKYFVEMGIFLMLAVFLFVYKVSFGQVGSASSDSTVVGSVAGGKCEDSKTGKKLSKDELVAQCMDNAEKEATKACDDKAKQESSKNKASICKCPAGAKLTKCELEQKYEASGVPTTEPTNLSDLSCGDLSSTAVGETVADLREAEAKLKDAKTRAAAAKSELDKAKKDSKAATDKAKAKGAEADKANTAAKKAANALKSAQDKANKDQKSLDTKLNPKVGSLKPGSDTAIKEQAKIDALNATVPKLDEAAKAAKEAADKASAEAFEAGFDVFDAKSKVADLETAEKEVKELEKQIAELRKKLDRDPNAAQKALVCTSVGKCSLRWNVECQLETGGAEETRKSIGPIKEPLRSVSSEGKNFSITTDSGRKFRFTPPTIPGLFFSIYYQSVSVEDVIETVPTFGRQNNRPDVKVPIRDIAPPTAPVTTAPASGGEKVGGQNIESGSRDQRAGATQSGVLSGGKSLFSPFKASRPF